MAVCNTTSFSLDSIKQHTDIIVAYLKSGRTRYNDLFESQSSERMRLLRSYFLRLMVEDGLIEGNPKEDVYLLNRTTDANMLGLWTTQIYNKSREVCRARVTGVPINHKSSATGQLPRPPLFAAPRNIVQSIPIIEPKPVVSKPAADSKLVNVIDSPDAAVVSIQTNKVVMSTKQFELIKNAFTSLLSMMPENKPAAMLVSLVLDINHE